MKLTDIVAEPISYDNLITTGGLIIVALISALSAVQIALLNRTRIHAKATREQTENEHKDSETPNLRNNIDSNQQKLIDKLDAMADTQRRQGNKIDRLFSTTNTLKDRLDVFEDTITRDQLKEVLKQEIGEKK